MKIEDAEQHLRKVCLTEQTAAVEIINLHTDQCLWEKQMR